MLKHLQNTYKVKDIKHLKLIQVSIKMALKRNFQF